MTQTPAPRSARARARAELTREIKNVARGRAVVIPISDATHGHSSHTWAVLWTNYLVELLNTSGSKS